jgi:hypothetical protein
VSDRRGRTSHVRPRPPVSDRPAKRARVAAPDPYRLRVQKGVAGRRRGLALPARALLTVSVVALGVAVLLTATGSVGKLVSALGSSFSGIIGQISATSTPARASVGPLDAPLVATPSEPYTNQAQVDLQISLPVSVVGATDARVRIYLTLEGQQPAPIAEVPVGATTKLVVPVTLTPGRNDFSATITRGAVESEPSPIVTFILDSEPPNVTITSPKAGATVNAETVKIVGTTQPRTSLVARNEANGSAIAAEAGSDGAFSLVLPIVSGPNGISIHATDPAGNTSDVVVSVLRGSGKLSANLTLSAYRISVKALPRALQLSVLVTDPDGAPLEGAAVTFTLTAPGIPPVTKDAVTAGDGRASFTTTLPTGVTTGSGVVTVLVSTDAFGGTTDQSAITFIP